MAWSADKYWFLSAVIVYGISAFYTVFLWRRGFRKDDWVSYGLIATGFCFHFTAMIKRGLSLNRCPIDNLYEATAFFMWALVGMYLILGVWPRLRFVGAFASPLLFGIGVFALFPGLDPATEVPRYVNGPVSLHAALILLGYGAFGVASVAAVMYLTQEHNLKFRKTMAIQSLLPSIQRLEVVNRRLLVAGLLLLTSGLAMSPFIIGDRRPAEIYGDAKFLWSILVWFLYGALVVMHWRRRLNGHRLAWGSAGAFVFVMLTFWGTNLLSDLH
ncbi:MAG TPA: cytochrome c biogenesis protein CcsA [Verrucomicrobiae bacterium]|nr:cytochrome c biogenesis protein CcsA [Verrucomicrobiae bacterium]